MASITQDDSGAGDPAEQPSTQATDQVQGEISFTPNPTGFGVMPGWAKWVGGLAAVLLVLIASLAIWGPGMEFPTTVSTSTIEIAGGGSIVNERSLREATTDAINAGVKWLTREASWLFGGITHHRGLCPDLHRANALVDSLAGPGGGTDLAGLCIGPLEPGHLYRPGVALCWLHGLVGPGH